MQTIVYEYGCLEPVEGKEHFEETVWLAHRYYNDLVAARRSKTLAFRAITAHWVEGISSLDEEADRIRARLVEIYRELSEDESDEIKAELKAEQASLNTRLVQISKQRKKLWKAHIKAEEETYAREVSAIEAYKKEVKATKGASMRQKVYKQEYRERWETFAQEHPCLTGDLCVSDYRYNDWCRMVRAHCGIHNGTYLQVEDAVERASKDSNQFPSFARWSNKRDKVFSGVQMRKPFLTSSVLMCEGGDKRFKIERQPGPKAIYYMAHVQIDTDAEDQPIYVVLPMKMHRPLPEDATLKWVNVFRTKKGRRYEWKVSIVFKTPFEQRDTPEQKGTCALDVGWRYSEQGVRVISWLATDGKHGFLCMPVVQGRGGNILDRLQFADELNSKRMAAFNEMRKALSTCLGTSPVRQELMQHIPKLQHLGKLRSPQGFAQAALYWKSNRLPGDGEAFTIVSAWLRPENKNYARECNIRARAVGARREFYRLQAISLCQNYNTLVLEDLDLSDMAQSKSLRRTSRRNRTRVALSEFHDALRLMAPKYGTTLEWVEPAYTSKTCHSCGERCDLDFTVHHHTCEHCTCAWDRDLNACRNIYRLYQTGSLGVSEDFDNIEPVGAPHVVNNQNDPCVPCEHLRSEQCAGDARNVA